MMSEKIIRLFAVAALLMACVAVSAQAPGPERVTVTAAKSRETVEKFAKAFFTPTKLAGKIARWESGICPVTVGQPPALASLVTQRVKDIAASVGAPVSSIEACSPNIQIVFTTTPQALLDDVRAHDPTYLGYTDTSSQREKLATITRPVQAWYSTETIDMDGIRKVDGARQVGTGITMKNIGASAMPFSLGVNRDPIYLPNATYAKVTGNHVNSAVRSGFNHVLIVVDTSKLVGRNSTRWPTISPCWR